MRIRIKKLISTVLFCVCLSVLTLATAAQKSSLRSLTVVTEPNASVWIDDVNYGKTDTGGKLVLKTFATGTHKIRVRAGGFKEVSQNLLPTQSGDLKIALVKTTDEAELAFQQAEEMSAVDREKAVGLYKKAVRLRPKYAEAYALRATILLSKGRKAEALVDLQKAVQIKPEIKGDYQKYIAEASKK